MFDLDQRIESLYQQYREIEAAAQAAAAPPNPCSVEEIKACLEALLNMPASLRAKVMERMPFFINCLYGSPRVMVIFDKEGWELLSSTNIDVPGAHTRITTNEAATILHQQGVTTESLQEMWHAHLSDLLWEDSTTAE